VAYALLPLHPLHRPYHKEATAAMRGFLLLPHWIALVLAKAAIGSFCCCLLEPPVAAAPAMPTTYFCCCSNHGHLLLLFLAEACSKCPGISRSVAGRQAHTVCQVDIGKLNMRAGMRFACNIPGSFAHTALKHRAQGMHSRAGANAPCFASCMLA
jgi:hypothetical protein